MSIQLELSYPILPHSNTSGKGKGCRFLMFLISSKQTRNFSSKNKSKCVKSKENCEL
jgi:hypothetical protein